MMSFMLYSKTAFSQSQTFGSWSMVKKGCTHCSFVNEQEGRSLSSFLWVKLGTTKCQLFAAFGHHKRLRCVSASLHHPPWWLCVLYLWPKEHKKLQTTIVQYIIDVASAAIFPLAYAMATQILNLQD